MTNICKIQAYDSMFRYVCIGFINFVLNRKKLSEYTNLISPNEYKNNDKILLQFSQ